MPLTSTKREYAFLQGGGELGALTRAFDWSKTSLGMPDGWPQSLRTTLGLVLHSAFPMFLFWGDELLCFYNDAYRPSLGTNGKHPALGKPGKQVWPEIWDFIGPLIEQVLTTAEPVWFEDQLVPIYRNGQLEDVYWTFSYSPAYGDDGEVSGILVTCVETTGKVANVKKLQDSEAKFRSLIEEAPVATALFVDRELTIEVANETMLGYWGKGNGVFGQPLAEALPELKGQSFLDQLDEVFTTGNAYEAKAARAELVVKGVTGTYYFDYTYKPLLNAAGEVYAIMDVAVDVTEEVKSRQKLEQTEAALRGAIELAELVTWSLDIEKNTIAYSSRFMNWLGFSEDTKALDEAYNPLPDEYRQSVADAIAAVVQPGSTGVYENEHPVINRLTGQVRIIHAQGQVVRDAAGKPAFLSGTAQDVTEQRRIQQELERQVQERTQQLQASVQELQRSNHSLQQFAYVASHDLQEPLRKVQQFGNLLQGKYGAQLGDGADLVERMQVAARRMSTLIEDLLTYSRISVRQEATGPVRLAKVVQAALMDLDLRVQETGAVVEVKPLPTVPGDASQLRQLFQNLLSNALKFRQPGVSPSIRVEAQRVAFIDLPPAVNPVRQAVAYHRIDVADNGIGFDELYLDRIFQVFQRLHSRNEFAGTGIGLAICEKVAVNHGGAISASSQPGQGATFSIYLPDR